MRFNFSYMSRKKMKFLRKILKSPANYPHTNFINE